MEIPQATGEDRTPGKGDADPGALASAAALSGQVPVLFCDQKIKGNVGYRARQVRGTGYTFAVLLTWLAVFFVILRLASGPYAAAAASIVTVLIWVCVAVVNQVPKAVRERCKLRLVPPETPGRVRCIGKVRRLARVLEEEPIADPLFEPMVFRGTGAIASSGARRVAQILIGVLAAAAGIGMQWYFLHRIGNVYLDMMFALGAAIVLGSALFPTYLRVVPGRMDIMECGWLGRKILSVQKVDLTSKPVLVDVNRQIVQVGDAADAPVVAFGAVWNRWEFAHAVLEAAVSTHTPPPLPDDALVG